MKSRLILHSDQSLALTLETDRKLLRSLTGKRAPKVAYVPSAPDPRRRTFREKEAYYEAVGVAETIFFDPCEGNEGIESALACDVVHLTGGIVTRFRDRLMDVGFDQHLRAFAARGGVVLGVSAGAMLLGRSFGLAGLFGEKGDFGGLGFFDFEVFPHRDEMKTQLRAVADFARKTQRDVWALADGDVVVLNGTKITTVGSPQLICGVPRPSSG